MKPRLLVAGFEPFGGRTVNASGEVAAALARSPAVAAAVVLPVTYRGAAEMLVGELERVGPSAVILFGEAEGTSAIRVEREAANVVGSDVPDEDGQLMLGVRICANAPDVYPSRLPVKRVVAELAAAGIPAAESSDAGGYVCNSTFFTLMHSLATTQRTLTGGLIHVPALSARPSDCGMSRAELTRAATAIVDVVLAESRRSPPAGR